MANHLKPELSENQQEIFDWIARYIEEHGKSPTVQEIADAFNVLRQAIENQLAYMERKGHIKRRAKKHRSIRLVMDRTMPSSSHKQQQKQHREQRRETSLHEAMLAALWPEEEER